MQSTVGIQMLSAVIHYKVKEKGNVIKVIWQRTIKKPAAGYQTTAPLNWISTVSSGTPAPPITGAVTIFVGKKCGRTNNLTEQRVTRTTSLWHCHYCKSRIVRKDFIWILAGQIPCELYRQHGYFDTDRAHLRLLSETACQGHWLTSLIELFFPEALAEFLRVTDTPGLSIQETQGYYDAENTTERASVSSMWFACSQKNLSSGTERTQSNSASSCSWLSYLLSLMLQ